MTLFAEDALASGFCVGLVIGSDSLPETEWTGLDGGRLLLEVVTCLETGADILATLLPLIGLLGQHW